MSDRILKNFKREDVPSYLLKGISYPYLAQRTVLDWGIILSCWWLMMNTTYLIYPFWAFIVAGRIHAFGVIVHDLCHQNILKKPLKMRVLEFFTGYFIGSTVNAMAYHHIRHHRHTLMNQDPYYKINKKCIGLKRFWLAFTKGLFFELYWITRSFFAPFAVVIPSLRNFYARFFLQDVSSNNLTNDKEVMTCIKEDIPLMLLHVILLALTLTKFDFLIYGYYAVLPVAGVLCIYRLLIEHEYDVVEDKSVYTLIDSTFDHHMTFTQRLFIGPHNVGYHCIHHIHPNAGAQSLPNLQKWYKENSDHYGEKYRSLKKLTWKEDLCGGIN